MVSLKGQAARQQTPVALSSGNTAVGSWVSEANMEISPDLDRGSVKWSDDNAA